MFDLSADKDVLEGGEVHRRTRVLEIPRGRPIVTENSRQTSSRDQHFLEKYTDDTLKTLGTRASGDVYCIKMGSSCLLLNA
jgi:hypothetical protein